MILNVGNLVEIRTTYGSVVGLLIQLNELSRCCKVLTRKGTIVECDEKYLAPYGINI